MSGLRLVPVWLVASVAVAQPSVLADDFEGRARPDTAPWDYGTTDEGVLQLTAAAAHRGAAGLRLDDQNAGTGQNVGSKVAHEKLGNAPASSWLRLWFRSAQLTQPGRQVVAQLGFGSGNTTTGRQQEIVLTGSRLTSDGRTTAGFTTTEAFVTLDGGWHLLELGWEGVGTSQGTRELFVDGTSAIRFENQAFGWPQSAQAVAVGGVFVERSFVGQLDFDDVRLSTDPPASQFGVVGDALVGRCTPLRLELRDSRQGVVELAPTELRLEVALEGADGAVHFGDGCDGGTHGLISAGTRGPWVVSVLANATGPATVVVQSDDLLTSRAPVNVVAEVAPPGFLVCGCAQLDGSAVLLAALVAVARRRARR